jgi:hypothetical protein
MSPSTSPRVTSTCASSDISRADPTEQVAWAIVFWSTVHTVAHMRNFVSRSLLTLLKSGSPTHRSCWIMFTRESTDDAIRRFWRWRPTGESFATFRQHHQHPVFLSPSTLRFQPFKVPDFRSHLSGVEGFFLANFITGPGVTGWIMTVALLVMVWFALEKQRRAHFER